MEDLKAQLRFLHETEVQETIEDAEKQASKIIEKAKEETEQIKNQKTKETLQKMHERETSQLALANFEGRKRIARAKSQLLDEVLAECKKKLTELAGKDEVNHKGGLDGLILEAATKLVGTDLEVVVNENDRKYMKENIRRLERELAKRTNTQVRLSLADQQPEISGGAIVRTRDGRQSFNNTWEARLAKVSQDMAGKISELLFEGAEV
jgi:vacuolar-type H+-ATPase subunit E/Vma4